MKISLISTVKNEVDNVDKLLGSLACQSRLPDEIIIVDAGSDDGTAEKLHVWQAKFNNMKIIVNDKCNRSEGRNCAISNSTGNIIAAMDFGCLLSADWLKEITEPVINNYADVTAGYYMNAEHTLICDANSYFTHPALFEISEQAFLPSTRSIAFKKECWIKVGGFDENFIIGEDTDFGIKLRKAGYKIHFNDKARVEWNAEASIAKMMKKLFNYSKWDGIGGFSIKFYQKKIVILIISAICAVLMFTNIIFIPLFLIITVYYTVKTFIRAGKKKINTISDIIVVMIKPLYDFIQSAGFVSGCLMRLFK